MADKCSKARNHLDISTLAGLRIVGSDTGYFDGISATQVDARYCADIWTGQMDERMGPEARIATGIRTFRQMKGLNPLHLQPTPVKPELAFLRPSLLPTTQGPMSSVPSTTKINDTETSAAGDASEDSTTIISYITPTTTVVVPGAPISFLSISNSELGLLCAASCFITGTFLLWAGIMLWRRWRWKR